MTYGLKRPSNVLKFNPITNELEKATINLVTRNGDYIDTIPYENLNVSFVGNGIDEVSFDIRKELGGIVNTLWDKLTGLKIIEYVGYGMFEANFQTNDGDEVIKTATCKSIEVELSQQIIRELHINDDEDISKPDYKVTYICDKNDEEHSLLHRVIKDKAPQWSIGHVDDLLCVNKKVYPTNAYQRTFTVDGISIYDFLTKDVCEECNCIITFDTINRTINLYNIKDYIYDLYTMEIVDGAYECDSIYYGLNGNVLSNDEYGYCQGVGKDTMIYISKNQLANSFSINEDTDSLKNCFYISGGDDTITGFIPAATMTGNNYIYIFDKIQKEDMPASLSSALDGYEELYNDSKVLYTGIGGVYVYDQTCTYDENTKTCRDSNNKILLDAIYNNNKVYVLDTCAYYNNGVAYTRDDNEIANGDYYYSSDGGIYTKYCHTLDRINYLSNAKFPNISLVDTTAENVANSISNYFQVVENKVYLKVSWTDINFSNVTSTVETMIGVKCDSRYEIKVNKSETSPTCTSISNKGVWAGNITVKSKTNELDNYSKDITVNAMLIDDDIASELDLFNKQKLSIAVSKQDISELDLSSYTTSEQLISYFKQYNKNSLDSYCKGFDSCVSTLDDLYSSVSDLSEIYAQLKSKYKLYYDSCKYVLDDISNKIELLNSQSDSIYNEIKDFQQTMSIKYYLDNIDDSLYPVFRSFIREGEYSNSNYISEGLSDSECLKKAIELVNIAEYNLKNACVVQKTVSGDLFSIFSQNDFKNVIDDFALFNYVRCRIDDKIYKLRLLSVSFSDNDTTKIDVNFSEDVVDINGITDDTKDILSKVSGISTTYSSTVQQAKQGLTAMHEFNKIHSEGLLSSDYVIANSDNEEVVQDRNGILIRSMSDIGCYGLNQMRITGNGIYLTDSAWESDIKMAIGLTKINGTWQYGVIADSIVGKLLLGEKAVIGNSSGTVTIDGDGIELDGGAITWKAGSTIPSSVVSGLDGTVSSIQDSLEQLDGRIQTYSQETQPTWTDANANHNGDLWIKPSTGTTKVYKSSSNSWEVSTDSTLSALASSKAQIFTSTPTVPYYVGDLWVTSTSSNAELKVCKTARTSGSYVASDWVASLKYTDDTKANEAVQAAASAKSKAETANSLINDISSDSKLTASEKQNLDITMKEIINEKAGVLSQADMYGISQTDYTNAYNTLYNYCYSSTGILYDLTTTSDIVSNTMKNNFSNYYKARQDLLSSIATEAKSYANLVEINSKKYADDVSKALGDTLNEQIDGKMETWNQTTDPSTSWSATDKTKHKGDIWYNGSVTKIWGGSSWTTTTDTTLKSLADSKKQVFTSTPVTPYYVGDLWVTSTTSNAEIKVCKTARTSGSYVASDWVASLKYTDDTKATSAYDLAASAKSAVDGLVVFKENVANTLGVTTITSDSIISPKIGGGYLYIANSNYSVEIDPNHEDSNTKNGYLMCIRNGEDILMGVDTDGYGYFKGGLEAGGVSIGRTGNFYGEFYPTTEQGCGLILNFYPPNVINSSLYDCYLSIKNGIGELDNDRGIKFVNKYLSNNYGVDLSINENKIEYNTLNWNRNDLTTKATFTDKSICFDCKTNSGTNINSINVKSLIPEICLSVENSSVNEARTISMNCTQNKIYINNSKYQSNPIGIKGALVGDGNKEAFFIHGKDVSTNHYHSSGSLSNGQGKSISVETNKMYFIITQSWVVGSAFGMFAIMPTSGNYVTTIQSADGVSITTSNANTIDIQNTGVSSVAYKIIEIDFYL